MNYYKKIIIAEVVRLQQTIRGQLRYTPLKVKNNNQSLHGLHIVITLTTTGTQNGGGKNCGEN